jgi:hypothetical protein
MASIAPGSELVAVAESYVAEGSVLAEGSVVDGSVVLGGLVAGGVVAGSVVEIEGGTVEGSVVQGVVQGGVVEGGDPARNTCDADEEAHQHGPQHGSVAVQRSDEYNDTQGAVSWLVTCPIFGVLSCTVWEGTTAGTIVLTIAIILYVIFVFNNSVFWHLGMT